MKMLPEVFTKKGFEHSQIWRRGNVAVYARKATTGTVTHYETIRIRADKGGKIASSDGSGKEYTIEAGERYPSSESWGILGWTFTDRNAAVAKAESL